MSPENGFGKMGPERIGTWLKMWLHPHEKYVGKRANGIILRGFVWIRRG